MSWKFMCNRDMRNCVRDRLCRGRKYERNSAARTAIVPTIYLTLSIVRQSEINSRSFNFDLRFLQIQIRYEFAPRQALATATASRH